VEVGAVRAVPLVEPVSGVLARVRVNDVKQHVYIVLVRRVDQVFKIVGCAVPTAKDRFAAARY
jgi:hypothetical protein